MFIVPSFEEIMQQETIKASEYKIKRKQERKAHETDPKHLFRKGVYELVRILDEKKAHEDENESLANDINMSLSFYYDDSLTDEEMALVKEVYESENKELVFEKYKNQCLDNINEAINRTEEQESCDRLYEFKERVNAKEYKYETLGEDVANFIELGKLVLA